MLLLDAVLLSLVVFAVVGVLGLIRFGGRLLMAATAAVATWAVAPLGPGQGWVPWLVFVAVLMLTGRRRRRRAMVRGPAWPGAVAAGPIASPLVPADPAAAVDDPWAAVRRLADVSQRRRLDAARATCERYLTLARTAERESALLPIKLARHVPALLADCAAHCASATRDEARALVEQAVASVEEVAGQAERRRLELAHAAQSRFRAIRAHLARDDE